MMGGAAAAAYDGRQDGGRPSASAAMNRLVGLPPAAVPQVAVRGAERRGYRARVESRLVGDG